MSGVSYVLEDLWRHQFSVCTANGLKPFIENSANGEQESFVVIHAGPAAETFPRGSPKNLNNIWSHKWNFPEGPFEANGVNVWSYLTLSEDSPVGTCAHEIGHLVFGW